LGTFDEMGNALTRQEKGRSPAVAIAGCLLAVAGALVLMGIVTAEALYDATYTTRLNEISDLGATRPPDSVSYQPSSGIFNGVMIAAGLMIIAAACMLHRGLGILRVTISIALLGIGVLGVGLFPGNRTPFHGIFALVAFVSGGVAAILSAKAQDGPLRYVSTGLGGVSLASLLFAIFGSSTLVFDEMGDGGVERWVAYPVVLWMVAFGGYLAAAR
jgi:hypothetical membrane protein